MAGNPIEAMVLIALGFRRLSMAPTAIGPVKTMIRSLDAGALARYLDEIAERPGPLAAPLVRGLCPRSRHRVVSDLDRAAELRAGSGRLDETVALF